MKALIDMPDHLYSVIKNKECTHMNVLTEAIANGTSIPDNATNGDVMRMLFPDAKIYPFEVHTHFYYRYDRYVSFLNDEWWNAPYKGR